MRRVAALFLLVTTPALAGPPFVTDDPEPPELHKFEINIAAQSTSHRGGREGALPTIDANYGAGEDLQLHLAAGLATQRSEGHSATYGYGDMEVGAKYRFLHQEEIGWDVAFYPAIDLPTGNERRGLGDGHARAFLPIWVQKDFGDWSTFGGGGYWIHPGTDNRNYWVVAWALLRKIDDHLSLGGELFHQSSDAVDSPGHSGFNLGGTYTVGDDDQIMFTVGRGLTHVAETNRFSYYVGYKLVF